MTAISPTATADDAQDVLVPSFAGVTEAPGTFGNHLDFWTPKASGHQPTDYLRGVELAREAMACANVYRNEAPIVFPLIEIATRGNLTLLEIGFLSRIGQAARFGAQN